MRSEAVREATESLRADLAHYEVGDVEVSASALRRVLGYLDAEDRAETKPRCTGRCDCPIGWHTLHGDNHAPGAGPALAAPAVQTGTGPEREGSTFCRECERDFLYPSRCLHMIDRWNDSQRADLAFRLKQAEATIERYRTALEEINDPILFMQLRAKGAGDVIDWPNATALAQSVPFLRSIARAALTETGREKEKGRP